MSATLSSENLKQTFAYPFQETGWQVKLIIAALIMAAGYLIPVLPWIFLAGYFSQIVRRIILEGSAPFLPEWHDWGEYLRQGIQIVAAGVVYFAPPFALMGLGYAVMMAPAFITAYAESSYRSLPDSFYLLFMLGPLAGMGIFGISMLIAIFFGLITPVAMCHLVAQDEFTAAFRFKEWWPIMRANLGGFALMYVIVLGAGVLFNFAAQFLYLTIILCCLVPFVITLSSTYLSLISSALFAQAYRQGRQKLGGGQTAAPESELSS